MDKIFKALADVNRRKILTMLKNNSLTVNQIVELLNIKQPTVSTHLAILKKSGLVISEIKGKNRIYRLNKQGLFSFVEELNRFVADEMIVRRIS